MYKVLLMSEIMLSIGITTCYLTDLDKFYALLLSLFDSEFTCDKLYRYHQAKRFCDSYKDKKLKDIKPISVDDNIEIIVYYDIGGDRWKEHYESLNKIISEFNFKNITWRVYRGEENVKVSAARNIIIQLATGKYVCFRDDDDFSVNVNELLNIVEMYPNYKCLLCFAMYYHEYIKIASIFCDSPWNLFINREWLIKSGVSFVPYMGNEDLLWRLDLNHALMKESRENNIKLVWKPIYAYLYPNARSNIENVYATKNDKIYNDSLLNDNNQPYEVLLKILNHEKRMFGDKIERHYHLYRAIGRLLSLKHGHVILKEYMMKHKNEFDIEEYLRMIEENVGSYDFWKLSDELRRECWKSFQLYCSVSDLYHFSKDVVKKNPVKFMQKMWDEESDSYEIISKESGKEYKLLNEYAWNWLSALRIKNDERVKGVELNDKVLDRMREYIRNSVKNVSDSDVYIWIFGNLARRTVMNQMDKRFAYALNCIERVGKENRGVLDGVDVKNFVLGDKWNDMVKNISDCMKVYVHESEIEHYNISPNVFMSYHTDIFWQVLLSTRLRNDSVNEDECMKNVVLKRDDVVVKCENDEKNVSICGFVMKEIKKGMSGGGDGKVYNFDKNVDYVLVLLFGFIAVSIVVIVIWVVFSCKFEDESDEINVK